MSSGEEDLHSGDQAMFQNYGSSPTQQPDYVIRAKKTVPTFVFVFYFANVTLQGFVFNSVRLRIAPFAMQHMNVTEEQASVVSMIFLMTDCLAPIFGGLVSDLVWTRYHVIFLTSTGFFIFYLLGIPLGFFTQISLAIRGGMFGIILFFGQVCSGITYILLINFGIEQLEDPHNEMIRRSLIRWNIWFCKSGHLLALPFFTFMTDLSVVSSILILAASALQIPMFVVWKRFYKMNTTTEGWKTLNHLHNASKRVLGLGQEAENDDQEQRWILDETPCIPKEVKVYQTYMLKRFVLLIVIFVTFGAFWSAEFMSGVVYPLQVKQMLNLTDEESDGWEGMQYNMMDLGVVLVLLVVIDHVHRSFSWAKRISNFQLIALALTLAAISLLIAYTASRLYISPGSKANLPNQTPNKLALIYMEHIIMAVGEILFLTAGFDMAYAEGPAHLKGTSMGLFIGLGSVFGCLIFAIYYSYPPVGLTHIFNSYGWVCLIVVITIIFMYIPNVIIYKRARHQMRQQRRCVNEELLDSSFND